MRKSGQSKLNKIDAKKKAPLPEYTADDIINNDKYQAKEITVKQALGLTDLSNDNISKRQKAFKVITSTLFIVFVLAVLVWTAYNDFSGGKVIPDIKTIWSTLFSNWYYLAIAVFCVFLTIFFKGLKLSIMCKERTGKFRLWTCIETGIIGHYYNNITPFAVGGQPFEIYHLSKRGIKGGTASSLPIAAFFLLQFAFVVLGFISLLSYNNEYIAIPNFLKVFPVGLNILAIIGLLCCFIMPLLIIIFSFFPSIGTLLVKFAVFLGSKFKLIKEPEKTKYHFTKNVLQNARCIKSLTTNKTVLSLTFIVSLAENLALTSIAYFTLRFFGFDIVESGGFEEWIIICEICFLLYAAISFIPTPGNSGAADLSFYLLFESGLSSVGNVAFPAMLVWRFLSFYSFIIIGFILTRSISRRESKQEQTEQQ